MSVTSTVGASLADQVLASFPEQVVRRRMLVAWGVPRRVLDAMIRAGRWRQLGQAVVLHSGPLSPDQRRSVALANVGGRALLTSWSGLAERGLRGWERDAVHVLVPFGARLHPVPDLAVVRHRVESWDAVVADSDGRRHGAAPCTALAADALQDPRHAVGLLAAVVQQRLAVAASLRGQVESRPRHRHRRLLLAALDDIEMGAQALSEIDFAQLCRSLGLPEPRRQACRTDAQGRRRYLDVEWTLADGRHVVVEIDGALHLRVERYWDDLFRQNDVALERSTTVLRFPSVAARTRDPRLITQLMRALR